MKQLILIATLFIGVHLTSFAQDDGDQRERAGKLEALKIAYLTKKMNLTPEEAQRFWPIYNRYAAEVRQAYIVYRDRQNEIELDEALLTIRKKYNSEFLKALSPEKVNQFFRAEKDFDGFVQKEMQRRQMQRRPFGGK